MRGNMFSKALVVGIIVLFIGMGVIPSIAQENSDVSTSSLRHSEPLRSLNFKLEFPKSGLYYYVSPFYNWLKNGILWADYELLKSWNNKPFPNETAMFVGGGVGFLPFYNVSVVLSAHMPDIPGKLDVYSDGEYYDTLYPEFRGPISVRFYGLRYYEKGFHTLSFVAKNNMSIVLDVQVGFKGFTKNILPYLL